MRLTPLALAALWSLCQGCALFLPQPSVDAGGARAVEKCGDPLARQDVTILEDHVAREVGPREETLRSGTLEVSGVTRFGEPCRYRAAFSGSVVVSLADPPPTTSAPYPIGTSRRFEDLGVRSPPVHLVMALEKYQLITIETFGRASEIVISRGKERLTSGKGRVAFLAPLAGPYEIEIKAFGPFDLSSFEGGRPPGYEAPDPWRHLEGPMVHWGGAGFFTLPRTFDASPSPPHASKVQVGGGGGFLILTLGFMYHARGPLFLPLVSGELGLLFGPGAREVSPAGGHATVGGTGGLVLLSGPGLGLDLGVGSWRLGLALRTAMSYSGMGSRKDPVTVQGVHWGWRSELTACGKVAEGMTACLLNFEVSDEPLGGPKIIAFGLRAMAY